MPGIYGTPSPLILSLISLNVEQAVIGLNTRNKIINTAPKKIPITIVRPNRLANKHKIETDIIKKPSGRVSDIIAPEIIKQHKFFFEVFPQQSKLQYINNDS